jgi:hypothetical protein
MIPNRTSYRLLKVLGQEYKSTATERKWICIPLIQHLNFSYAVQIHYLPCRRCPGYRCVRQM